MSVPSDTNIKLSKDLEIKVTKMWHLKATTLSVVIDAFGMVANHHHHIHISYIYYTLCSSTDLTLTFERVLSKLVYRAY